jgi:hypothetical protein
MKITVHVQEMPNNEGWCKYLGEKVFDSTDVSTFLVAPWVDRDTPGMLIPDGMHIIGFRFFQTENSITVYVGKGILVKI